MNQNQRTEVFASLTALISTVRSVKSKSNKLEGNVHLLVKIDTIGVLAILLTTTTTTVINLLQDLIEIQTVV